MTLRISTDIGGTFTDLVCVDQNGDLRVAKVSTTSEELCEGHIRCPSRARRPVRIGR